MKRAKFGLLVLIVVLFVTLVLQNQNYFMAQTSLRFNLVITEYHLPAFFNVIVMSALLMVGALCAYFMGLADRFIARQTIRSLESDLDAEREQLFLLRQELQTLKGDDANKGTGAGDTQSAAEP